MPPGKPMLLDTFPSRAEFRSLLDVSSVVPVGVRILADTETPVSLLARFAPQSPHLFLLESAEGGERWGRYSFMGVSARATVTVFRNDVVIRQGIGEKRIPHQGDPLNVLRGIMKPYSLAHLPGLPRFCGGLVGYFSYEMIHFFESRVPNKLPPERPMAEFVIPDTLLIFDNIHHTLTALALAFREDAEPDALYDMATARVQDLLATLAKPLPVGSATGKTPIRKPEPVHPPEYFKGMVEKVKDHIYEGDIIQCVVSQSFVGPAPDDLVSLYRAQRHVNPSPYLVFLKAQDSTLIVSSPETMIRLDSRVATLRPIAGTRPRGATEQEDRKHADSLLRDEKERAEHLMLVDLGRNELGRVALPGTVQVTDLMIVERYSHVMHLVSNITADVEPGHDAFDLFAASFPAGTLSGAPKIRAMEIIADLEDEPRGPYGGAAGYFSFDGNMDFCICIRMAVAEHGRLTVRAGAGIVADSDPETEQHETLTKAAAMARALELLQTAQHTESKAHS
ncbi:MAG: anthranilate synthase component I family protein [Kiritimatiellia bacterium]|nr:anthranilate synthase component I family protein [Kiritimatiellia bacterium]